MKETDQEKFFSSKVLVEGLFGAIHIVLAFHSLPMHLLCFALEVGGIFPEMAS